MQRQIDFSARRSIVTTTVAVAVAVAVALVISIAVVSSVWVAVRSAPDSFCYGMRMRMRVAVRDWIETVRSSSGCRLSFQVTAVNRNPILVLSFNTRSVPLLCAAFFHSVKSIDLSYWHCSRCSITVIWIGVDPIRAYRFPSRFCLASAFVSFECRWYRDVIWSSVHPRSHSVILICVPVLTNVCNMCP